MVGLATEEELDLFGLFLFDYVAELAIDEGLRTLDWEPNGLLDLFGVVFSEGTSFA